MNNPSKLILERLKAFGEVNYPQTPKDVRLKENEKCIYMISNGSNVLQIGQGNRKCLCSCMRGGLASKHNKAFICAIAELVFGQPNAYAYVSLASDRVKNAERELHQYLGVETNKESATVIEGIECRSILEIHQALWIRAKDTDCYKALDSIEKEMAEELFELVTYATVKIQRSNRLISSCQGDNLEGNILKKIGKNYLIDVFIKLTNGYLRYGIHRMKPQEFENCKQTYLSYKHHGKPFDFVSKASSK